MKVLCACFTFMLLATSAIATEFTLEFVILRSVEREKALCITLDSGKVYVGPVVEAPNPEKDTKIVQIMPWYSGYRDEQGLTRYTTDYQAVYEAWHNDVDDLSHVDFRDLVMAISVTEIVSLGYFDGAVNKIMDDSNHFNGDIFSEDEGAPSAAST